MNMIKRIACLCLILSMSLTMAMAEDVAESVQETWYSEDELATVELMDRFDMNGDELHLKLKFKYKNNKNKLLAANFSDYAKIIVFQENKSCPEAYIINSGNTDNTTTLVRNNAEASITLAFLLADSTKGYEVGLLPVSGRQRDYVVLYKGPAKIDENLSTDVSVIPAPTMEATEAAVTPQPETGDMGE